VEQGLAAGADANAPDAQGVTPLMRAVAAGHRQVAQALLRANADPNTRVGAVRTPPIFLVLSRPSAYDGRDLPRILANQLAILDDLIAAGSSIESTKADNRTLLLEVARMNYDDGSPGIIMKGLIERGANVSARDADGHTAIMLAVMDTHPKVSLLTLPVLLAAGADVNATDQAGKLAIDYARERAKSLQAEDWPGVVKLLADARTRK
jgi:ankyrin repeat protein